MIAVLRGIKAVEYTKKDTGERKKGLELHLVRKPFPMEPFVVGSEVVFTEYVPRTDNSEQLCQKVLGISFGSSVDLVYVQNGRYSNLVDVNEYVG